MSKIFISYASKDQPWAEMLVTPLKQRGWTIFWDRTIPVGMTWHQVIDKELTDAHCVIVLWSKASIQSEWVQEEAAEGRRRDILLPVLIEAVQPPLGFRSKQAANLSDWGGTKGTPEFHRLIAGIERLVGSPQTEVEQKNPRAEPEVLVPAEAKRLAMARPGERARSQAHGALLDLGVRPGRGVWGYELVFPEGATDETLVEASKHFAAIPPVSFVDLKGTKVLDVGPLQGLSNLERLSLWDTPVSDLSPLQGLAHLKDLTLWDSPVCDLGPLQGLTNLQELRISGKTGGALFPLENLSPLKSLTNLQTLEISRKKVSDFAPLQGLRNLESLNLDDANTSDLGPLRGLTNLRALCLRNTPVSDLRPLQDLTNLVLLYLWCSPVSDLRPLQGLTNLQWLGLGGTKVSDLGHLKALTNLLSLSAERTKVFDLQPLMDLLHLKKLEFRYTKVSDLSPLQGLTNLEKLDFSYTKVSDLGPLKGMICLEELNVQNTLVSLEQVDAFQAALPHSKIYF